MVRWDSLNQSFLDISVDCQALIINTCSYVSSHMFTFLKLLAVLVQKYWELSQC